MKPLIIDVRHPFEYAVSHAGGAINIPLDELENDSRIAKLPKNQPIVVYCNSGSRSHFAKGQLDRMGFADVTNGINQDTIKKNR